MASTDPTRNRPEVRDYLGVALVVLCIGAAINGDSSAISQLLSSLPFVL